MLVLPSQRTLRDYRHYITPQRGFSDGIVSELENTTRNFSRLEKFVVLSFDEMKIQDDLVWDKNIGELVGFLDLGDVDLNCATLPKVDKLASYVMVFLIKSVMNPLAYTFATDGVTSSQIFPLFWKAVAILELTCKLKVIATVADGASQNRAFYKMHSLFPDEDNPDLLTFKTRNIYAPDRYIWFFCDAPPHLIKTTRNCLSNSGMNRCTRYMWINGCNILWSHISQLYFEDAACDLKYFPK